MFQIGCLEMELRVLNGKMMIEIILHIIYIAIFIDFLLLVTGNKSIMGWILDKLGL